MIEIQIILELPLFIVHVLCTHRSELKKHESPHVCVAGVRDIVQQHTACFRGSVDTIMRHHVIFGPLLGEWREGIRI